MKYTRVNYTRLHVHWKAQNGVIPTVTHNRILQVHRADQKMGKKRYLRTIL